MVKRIVCFSDRTAMRFIQFFRWELRNCELKNNIEKIGKSKIFTDELKKIAISVCKNNASILLVGEKGTGKSLFAEYIHYIGNNSVENFYSFNCKSFSDKREWNELINIINDCTFLSEQVTIFFNYVNQLPVELNENLVCLIKDSRFKNKNIRFIFSSDIPLEENVELGLFSKELYFLICNVLINVVPLRQRKEDIIPIAEYFFDLFKKIYNSEMEGFSDEAKSNLKDYFWSGNLLELKNAVERGFIFGKSSLIKSGDMALDFGQDSKSAEKDVLSEDFSDKSLKNALDSFKKAYVTKILEENDWNQTKAAKVLGIQRTYVIRLINELQIRNKQIIN